MGHRITRVVEAMGLLPCCLLTATWPFVNRIESIQTQGFALIADVDL